MLMIAKSLVRIVVTLSFNRSSYFLGNNRDHYCRPDHSSIWPFNRVLVWAKAK